MRLLFKSDLDVFMNDNRFNHFSFQMIIIDMSLKNIIFCDHMNENICDLRNIIQAIKMKKSIQLKYKKIIDQEMRSIDISDLIDDERFMIEQLIMKEKKNRSYIMRETIKWMNLKNDFCDEIIEDYDNCKLKNLKMIINYERDNWNELINDKG